MKEKTKILTLFLFPGLRIDIWENELISFRKMFQKSKSTFYACCENLANHRFPRLQITKILFQQFFNTQTNHLCGKISKSENRKIVHLCSFFLHFPNNQTQPNEKLTQKRQLKEQKWKTNLSQWSTSKEEAPRLFHVVFFPFSLLFRACLPFYSHFIIFIRFFHQFKKSKNHF